MALHLLFAVLAALLGAVLLTGLWILFSALAVPKGREYDAPSRYYRFVIDAAMAICRVALRMRITLEGREKLPEDGHYLLVGNHISAFDPFAVLLALRREKVTFISKPENLAIPVIGPVIRRAGFIAIDRENPRAAVTAIRRASDWISAGHGPVMVYPEGTRSKTGELLPFHNAVFKAAQSAKCPVAVVAVAGTDKIRSRAPWRRTDIRLRVCAVLPAEEIAAGRTNAIGERVRSLLLEDL